MWYHFKMTEKKILEKYTNTKNRPTLLPYIDDIKFLVDNDASQQAILDFLQIEKNVTVCKSTVSVFIKKHITKKSYKPPIKRTYYRKQRRDHAKIKKEITIST